METVRQRQKESNRQSQIVALTYHDSLIVAIAKKKLKSDFLLLHLFHWNLIRGFIKHEHVL